MGFETFMVYLAVSVVVAGILHYGMSYSVRTGWDSFVSKVMIGYFGAYYIGTYFGEWGDVVAYGNVHDVPALLGAFGLLVFAVDMVKTFKF